MLLILTLCLNVARATTPLPAVEDLWMRARTADSATLPAGIAFGADDLALLRLDPAWDPAQEDLALRWGRQLFIALELSRHGYERAAQHEIQFMLETLGKMNLRAKDLPTSTLQTMLNGVAREVARKLGPVSDDDRVAFRRVLDPLVDLVAHPGRLISSGRGALAEPRTRAIVDSLAVSASLSMITGIFIPVSGLLLGYKEMDARLFAACLAGVGGVSFAVNAWICRPIPKLPRADDPNLVEPLMRNCVDVLTGATSPADAATASAATPI